MLARNEVQLDEATRLLELIQAQESIDKAVLHKGLIEQGPFVYKYRNGSRNKNFRFTFYQNELNELYVHVEWGNYVEHTSSVAYETRTHLLVDFKLRSGTSIYEYMIPLKGHLWNAIFILRIDEAGTRLFITDLDLPPQSFTLSIARPEKKSLADTTASLLNTVKGTKFSPQAKIDKMTRNFAIQYVARMRTFRSFNGAESIQNTKVAFISLAGENSWNPRLLEEVLKGDTIIQSLHQLQRANLTVPRVLKLLATHLKRVGIKAP